MGEGKEVWRGDGTGLVRLGTDRDFTKGWVVEPLGKGFVEE